MQDNDEKKMISEIQVNAAPCFVHFNDVKCEWFFSDLTWRK